MLGTEVWAMIARDRRPQWRTADARRLDWFGE